MEYILLYTFATYTKHTVGGSTAETNVTFTIVDKGSKKYFAYPATTIEKDLDNHTITTTRQFNTTYGYITQEKTVYDKYIVVSFHGDSIYPK